jgi:tripartite-type tricarboxylate transporter receptor subunit TctC
VCGAAALPWQAQAQDSANWPVKPVRMLVGSAPGGGTDAMARAVADRLGPLLKQPVIVENRPGVSNTLAVDMTAKATDGHTMVMGVVTAHAIAPHLLKLGYDNNRDLVPVAFVGSVPNVLVVGNSVAANTVAELVAMARKNPGQINFASSGTGSTQHIAAEVFKDAAGIQITRALQGQRRRPGRSGQRPGADELRHHALGHRPDQGRQAACSGGHFAPAQPQLPQVPTMAEAGLRDVEISAWYGIYMPASTPKAVQQKCMTRSTRSSPCPRPRPVSKPWVPSCGPCPRPTSAVSPRRVQALRRHHSQEQHQAGLSMSKASLPVVALTLGDPSGIGAELIARLLAASHRAGEPGADRRSLALGAGPAHRRTAGGNRSAGRPVRCARACRYAAAGLCGRGHGRPGRCGAGAGGGGRPLGAAGAGPMHGCGPGRRYRRHLLRP